MSDDLYGLLENNKAWAAEIKLREPDFFQNLTHQQSPSYLWIGCSDSRVPANEIVRLKPGEMFVHRNVANVVVHSDLNCLSVMQYAVEALKVSHIIVCGHYGCGGVKAAFQNLEYGLIDNWLRHVQDVRETHEEILSRIDEEEASVNTLCELNVIEQVVNVCQTTIVRTAWKRGQELTVHGWIYDLSDGILRDLRVSAANPRELTTTYESAIAAFDRDGRD